MLPEGCIAEVLSLTTPKDACRLSLVSTTFHSAADSDAVWDKFLPSDCISQSTATSSPLKSKKELYLWLCHHPLIIDHGTKSLSVEKSSGKRCYMLGARTSASSGVTLLAIGYGLVILIPVCLILVNRFGEVAELMSVCWLEIRGKININLLSQNSIYTAFLVYKLTEGSHGFENKSAEGFIGLHIEGDDTRTVYLDPSGRSRRGLRLTPWPVSVFFNLANTRMEEEDEMFHPKVREDGWMEIELGEYYINNIGNEDKNMELEMSLMEVKGGNWKSGLIVQGIEIRPKLN